MPLLLLTRICRIIIQSSCTFLNWCIYTKHTGDNDKKNWCLVIRAQGDHTDQARVIYCFNTLVFTPIPQDSKPRWLWLIPGLHVHFTRHLYHLILHVFMFFLVASFQYFFRYGTCVCTLIKISGSGSTSNIS